MRRKKTDAVGGEIEKGFVSLIKYFQQTIEEERKSIPPALLREGDSTLAEIYKLVCKLFSITQKVKGVKILDEEIAMAAEVPTLMVQVLVEYIVNLYSRGYDIETATGMAMASLLKGEAIAIILAAIGASHNVNWEEMG